MVPKPIPTLEHYKEALEIVESYEKEQDRLFYIRLEAFRAELTEYFKDNTVCDYFIKSFTLEGEPHGEYDIIPQEPPLEECYGGENDDHIEAIAKKHGVQASFAIYVYHK